MSACIPSASRVPAPAPRVQCAEARAKQPEELSIGIVVPVFNETAVLESALEQLQQVTRGRLGAWSDALRRGYYAVWYLTLAKHKEQHPPLQTSTWAKRVLRGSTLGDAAFGS